LALFTRVAGLPHTVAMPSDAFDDLLRKLSAEHARVVSERDELLRHTHAKARIAEVRAGETDCAELTHMNMQPLCDPRTGPVSHTHEPDEEDSVDDQPMCPALSGDSGLIVPKALINSKVTLWNRSASQSSHRGADVQAQIDIDSLWHDLYLSNDPASRDTCLSKGPSGWALAQRASRKRPSGVFNQVMWQRMSFGDWKSVPLRPHDRCRFVWDLLGTAVIMYDIISIPVQAAFNAHADIGLVLSACMYWFIDIGMSFNTAFVRDGSLETSRSKVAKHYLKRWFLFDIVILSAELALLYLHEHSTRNRQALAIARTVGLLRVFQIRRVSDNFEEFVIDMKVPGAIVLYTIAQIVFAIFFAGHILTCAWCYMSLEQHAAGQPSWLLEAEALYEASPDQSQQYLRSHTWISGHLLSAPIDKLMVLRTDADHVFALALIWTKLFLMGAAISKISGALGEIGRANAQAKDTKRKLQKIAQEAGMSKDVSKRMIRFALFSQRRARFSTVDPSVARLLSGSLSRDLIVNQRSRYLLEHPLFSRVQETHPEAYAKICTSLKPQVYADREQVFQQGTLSEVLYITYQGVFFLEHEIKGFVDEFSEVTWLCEIALFARAYHSSSLSTATFAEAFTLSGSDLAGCVRTWPLCIRLLYRYAEQLVSRIRKGFDTDAIDKETLQECLQAATRSGRSMVFEVSAVETPIKRYASEGRSHLSMLFDKSAQIDSDRRFELLQMTFPEVEETSGTYDKLNLSDDRKRTICALNSIVLLMRDEYEEFIAHQPVKTKMPREVWAQMQEFLRWADLSHDRLYVVLVYLTLRNIAKDPEVADQLGLEAGNTEASIRLFVEQYPQLSPSAGSMTDEQVTLFHEALVIHDQFNVAQFLQGEISPFQIAALQEITVTNGLGALKIFLLQNLGFMCGLRGSEIYTSSLFMDATHSTTLLTALQVLVHLEGSSPQAVYWNFIAARAAQLGLPAGSRENFVVARLACLCRSERLNMRGLPEAWQGLNASEREILINHFIADGIGESNFVLKFLPAFFANAHDNPHVGLHAALVMLCDVIELLNLRCEATKKPTSRIVNLQDLAQFTEKVQSHKVFQAVGAYLNFVGPDMDMTAVVATAHMQRVNQKNWSEQPAQEAASLVKRMSRQLEALEAACSQRGRGPKTERQLRDIRPALYQRVYV